MEGISSKVWWEGGNEEYCHSREDDENSGYIVVRLEENASQMRKINTIVAISEIVDPMDDTVFQRVYASG